RGCVGRTWMISGPELETTKIRPPAALNSRTSRSIDFLILFHSSLACEVCDTGLDGAGVVAGVFFFCASRESLIQPMFLIIHFYSSIVRINLLKLSSVESGCAAACG